MQKWIDLLEEAIKCDPDLGDPYTCLDEVELIIKKMKEDS